MCLTARKSTKGFTLLEVLVVIGIITVLTSMIGSGVIYLNNSVALDTKIREVKAELQETQNNALNSMIARNPSASDDFSDQRISIGWLVELRNNTGGQGIQITQRSIYFNYNSSSGQDLSNLRDWIIAWRDSHNSAGSRFDCEDSGGSISGFGRLAGSEPESFVINCFNEGEGDEDYRRINVDSVLLDPVGDPKVPSCAISTSGDVEANIFFTSGYAETIFSGLNPKFDCQLRVRNIGAWQNFRALRISKDTGGVSFCNSLCTD